MKLIHAFTAYLVVDAAHASILPLRPPSLRSRISAKQNDLKLKEKRAAELRADYAQSQRDKRSEADHLQNERVGEVKHDDLDNDAARELVKLQADGNNAMSRRPSSSSSPEMKIVMKKAEPWEMSYIYNTYIANAKSLTILDNFLGTKMHDELEKQIIESQKGLSRIGLQISTGAPAIYFVKGKLQPIVDRDQNMRLLELTNKYTDFMQDCEENIDIIFNNVYRVFVLIRAAVRDLADASTFFDWDQVMQTYSLTEAVGQLNKSQLYFDNIVTASKTMGDLAETLQNEFRTMEGDFADLRERSRVRDNNRLTIAADKNVENAMLIARNSELEQKIEALQNEIEKIDAQMDATSAELAKKIVARKNLASNIIPEKREHSPAHWRMFYEELCDWYEEWDCEYDTTSIFQWVVDPSVIKKHYVKATNEINELKDLNVRRLEKKNELLDQRISLKQNHHEYVKNVNDGLHEITGLYNPRDTEAYTILNTGTQYLDKVKQAIGEVTTEFKEWTLALVNNQDKRSTLLRDLGKMQEDSPLRKPLMNNYYKLVMQSMDEMIGDMIMQVNKAFFASDDVAWYRTYTTTQITTMSTDNLYEYMTQADEETELRNLMGLYRAKEIKRWALGKIQETRVV